MHESLKTNQTRVGPPAAPNQRSDGAPPQDTWDRLLKQTELFAAEQAAVRWWRHAHDGVMPDGYDPSSIAAQAVTDLLKNRRPPIDQNLSEDQIRQIQNELEYLVRKLVDRLRHRKENSLVCNEPDMSPVTTDDGEDIRLIETLPDPSPTPAQVLLDKEHTAEVEQVQQQFAASLGKDRPLKTLFQHLCTGVSAPRVLAAKLKRTPRSIDSRLKRLRRKFQHFVKH